MNKIMDLSSVWSFCYRPSYERDGMQSPIDDSFSAAMPVPAYWDDHIDSLRGNAFWKNARFNPVDGGPLWAGDSAPDGQLPYLLGVGWYRRILDIPSNCMATLHVGGVMQEAWVWLNGILLHHHLGHSTPFEVALKTALKAGGTNELVIAVSNLREDRIGCAIRGYKGRSGGICGRVFLRLHGTTSIDSIYLCADSSMEKIEWNVIFGNAPIMENALLTWTVHESESGRVVATGTQSPVGYRMNWSTSRLDMMPWSDTCPVLYRIEVALLAREQILDCRTQSFGLRRLTTNGMKLLLNGRPIYLRGITEHAYYPITCTPPTDKAFYRQAISRWKAMGFNWLRFHTWVPPREYLEAADELGMLIQVEPPRGFERQEWLDILHACRTHPSVVIYCAGNEELLDETKIDQLRACARDCHTEVPDALFNPQEALRGVEYAWADDKPQNQFGHGYRPTPYPHNSARLSRLKEFSDIFGQYSWGWHSYKSLQADWRQIDRRLAAYERPCLTHEAGITGNYLDLSLEPRYRRTRIGTALFEETRRNLIRAGVLDRAEVYYRNSCRWASLIRKHNLERVRLCRRLAGFDYLGGIDTHWHRTGYPCGLLNEFFEVKPGDDAQAYLSSNGPTVILLDLPNQRNYGSGERITLPLHISHFGADDVIAATVQWRLCDGEDNVHASGILPQISLQCGDVYRVGIIEFTLPLVSMARQLTLMGELTTQQVICRNQWNIAVFPRYGASTSTVRQTGESDVWSRRYQMVIDDHSPMLLDTIDATVMHQIERGGSALLLGPGGLPALSTTFQPSTAGRVLGNLATVIAEHPCTNVLPHEGFAGWPFYTLLEGGHAIILDDSRLPFAPLVEVVSSFKHIIRQAALLEWRIGKGRLMICGFNLQESDPAAAVLMDAMVRYLADRGAWRPAPVVEIAALLAAMRHPFTPVDIIGTDAGFDARVQLNDAK